MKTICILKDKRPFWNEITMYLEDVNVKVFCLDGKSVLQEISDKTPEIIIAGEKAYKEMSSVPERIPKLIITEGNIAETKSRNVYFLRWPVRREPFLEMTSRLLYISERRLFTTVITIMPKGKEEPCFGRSVNFSMSGMAFKSDKLLKQGDILTISFYIPDCDKRVKVEVEIMRNSVDPQDRSLYYGARFLNIEDNVKDELESFIKKIK